MNPTLRILFILMTLSLQVFAARDRGRESSRESGRNVTYTPRTTTPAPQTFKNTTPRSQPVPVQFRQPQQRESRTLVQPAQPAAVRPQPTAGTPQTVRSPRPTPESRAERPTVRSNRERQEPNKAVVAAPKAQEPNTTPQRTFTPSRERQTPRVVKQPQTVKIERPTTERHSTEKQSSPFLFNERATTKRSRDTETVRAPTRTPSTFNQDRHKAVTLRSPQREHTDRTRPSAPTSYRHAGSRPVNDRPRHELTTRRPPKAVRPPPRSPERHSYYAHHYPTRYNRCYRPVTCYSSKTAFWHAFGFTVGASLFAPFYFADVVFPYRSYVTTTWRSGPVTVSVSRYAPYYPVYTYRPYYCSSGWYYHDGWHHSYAYYGGWRYNWYGGFSYIFNPYPVYRTYYLTETPATVVIEQPAQQIVYVNQPAQQTVAASASAAPAPQVQLAEQTEATGTEQTAVTPEARCFCACKCNGRVPCICEYPCGSEFAYSPEDYTLAGFSSYAESLDPELIWSSYAGLDRSEPEAYIAGNIEQ
jgi:hypothetical protein